MQRGMCLRLRAVIGRIPQLRGVELTCSAGDEDTRGAIRLASTTLVGHVHAVSVESDPYRRERECEKTSERDQHHARTTLLAPGGSRDPTSTSAQPSQTNKLSSDAESHVVNLTAVDRDRQPILTADDTTTNWR